MQTFLPRLSLLQVWGAHLYLPWTFDLHTNLTKVTGTSTPWVSNRRRVASHLTLLLPYGLYVPAAARQPLSTRTASLSLQGAQNLDS